MRVYILCSLSAAVTRATEVVAAGIDDLGHEGSELGTDIIQAPFTPGILHNVLQHGGYDLVLVSSVLKNDRSHRQRVGHIRNLRSFPAVAGVR
jgi:hypothetical protein